MTFFVIWLCLCFVVGAAGDGRRIGYWGVFFISLVLSPLVGLIAALLSNRNTPTVPMSMHRQETKMEQLERITRLRNDGGLTDEEFQAEKAKLMGEPKKPEGPPQMRPSDYSGMTK